MDANEKPNLSDYAGKLIKYKAKQLVGHYGFTRSDREDIEQDLAQHLIEHMHQFDPRRSSQNTFLNRIVDRKRISILRQRFAQRRDYRMTTRIDDLATDAENDQFEPVDQRIERVGSPSDLAIDLAHASESLDGDTQHMCRLLMHESIAETARRLGLTRAQVRTRIARAHRLLTDQGLDIYVNVRPANSDADGVSNK